MLRSCPALSDVTNCSTLADVTKYLQFKAVDGSYVLNQGRIHKVPATDVEALKSQLFGTFGFFEKRRARNFFKYVQVSGGEEGRGGERLEVVRV